MSFKKFIALVGAYHLPTRFHKTYNFKYILTPTPRKTIYIYIFFYIDIYGDKNNFYFFNMRLLRISPIKDYQGKYFKLNLLFGQFSLKSKWEVCSLNCFILLKKSLVLLIWGKSFRKMLFFVSQVFVLLSRNEEDNIAWTYDKRMFYKFSREENLCLFVQWIYDKNVAFSMKRFFHLKEIYSFSVHLIPLVFFRQFHRFCWKMCICIYL